MKKVPTPEELAEENRRAEEARGDAPERDENGNRILPKPDPEFAREVRFFFEYDNPTGQLSDGTWLPSTPAEVAAALSYLAGSIEGIIDVAGISEPTLWSLRGHFLALESLLTGQTVEWMANLDEDPAGNGPTRIPFQLLYRQFEARRLAGENAGLNQRIEDLERRLALLEQRLDPDADYRPAGLRYDGCLVSCDDEDDPLAALWANHHEPDGTRSAPNGKVMDEPLDDIENGHLRPQTWAQMCDCLSDIAGAVHTVLSGVMDLEEGAHPMQQLVANLTRAAASTSPRPPHDIAEALVLETVTRLLVDRREEEASQVQSMWRVINDYSQDRHKTAGFKKSWKLVRADEGLVAAGAEE